MGMDVYGKNPKSKKGEYFRNSVWSWRPLWIFCESMYSEIANKVEYAQSNSCDGLNEEDSIKLSKLIERDLDAGLVHAYALGRNVLMGSIPLEYCDICNGTGQRDDAIIKGKCNVCAGVGKKEQFLKNYPFDVENVREWMEFLKDCGGFEIN